MINEILAGRGALERADTPSLTGKLRRVGNVAEHLGYSLLSMVQPSRQRIGFDPLAEATKSGQRYAPVPIDRLKLAGRFGELVLEQRGSDSGFEVLPGKRLGVVIPYRARAEQLKELVERLEIVLAEQDIDYRIVVAEQSDPGLFNRGKMKNVGADLLSAWADYFCFHDVDNIPALADYRCPSQPMRLVKRYTQTYRVDNPIEGYFFGAVVSIRREQFNAVNGYDNRYWGWGQEDEDFFLRCLRAGMVPHEDTQGIYCELDNPSEELVERTFLVRRRNRYLMKAGMLGRSIGCSGLASLEYRVASSTRNGRLLHVCVDI